MEPYLASISSPYEHVRLIIHDAKPVNVSLLPASIYEAQCSLSPMRFVRRWGFTEKGAWIWAKIKFSPLVNSLVGWVVVQSSKRRRYLNSWTMSFTELIRHNEQNFKCRCSILIQEILNVLKNRSKISLRASMIFMTILIRLEYTYLILSTKRDSMGELFSLII
jgi:hypothetical protein